MKKGMARSGKESSAAKAFWAIMIKGMSLVRAKVTAVAIPKAMPMGRDKIKKRTRQANRTAISI